MPAAMYHLHIHPHPPCHIKYAWQYCSNKCRMHPGSAQWHARFSPNTDPVFPYPSRFLLPYFSDYTDDICQQKFHSQSFFLSKAEKRAGYKTCPHSVLCNLQLKFLCILRQFFGNINQSAGSLAAFLHNLSQLIHGSCGFLRARCVVLGNFI